jgi:hypothetical protein
MRHRLFSGTRRLGGGGERGNSRNLLYGDEALGLLLGVAAPLHQQRVEGSGALPLVVQGDDGCDGVAATLEAALSHPSIELLDEGFWHAHLDGGHVGLQV